MASAATPQPIFYYELGSPVSYLLAETITSALMVVPDWTPVLDAELGAQPAFDPVAIEQEAAELGLLPLRWPPGQLDSRLATLAATYAKQIGRVVAFSLACFRQTFAAGRDPGIQETVLLAAAACEMHPAAVLRAVKLRSVEGALEQASQRARGSGVRMLPAIQIGDRLFEGPEAAQRTAAALGALT